MLLPSDAVNLSLSSAEQLLMPWRHINEQLDYATRVSPQDAGFPMGDEAMGGTIHYFTTPVTNRPVLLCVPTKVASTGWRLLLLMAMALPSGHPNVVHPLKTGACGHLTARLRSKLDARWPQPVTPSDVLSSDPHCVTYWRPGFKSAMADKRTLRVMITRNPYTRLLSAFLDKVAIEGDEKALWGVPKRPRTPEAFRDFARKYILRAYENADNATSLRNEAFLRWDITRKHAWPHMLAGPSVGVPCEGHGACSHFERQCATRLHLLHVQLSPP